MTLSNPKNPIREIRPKSLQCQTPSFATSQAHTYLASMVELAM